MCGIVGMMFTDRSRLVDAPTVERMNDSLVHRGPDDGAVFVDRYVGLGNRRLAIMDPTHGRQPMTTPDGRFTIVFNGEIYNFRELRAQLVSKGHRFQTDCDTEALLRAFVEWGKRCLERIDGMFAFAVWDRVEEKLFIARDRFGIKPLFFRSQGSIFSFASEIKALLPGSTEAPQIDHAALVEMLLNGYPVAPKTLFAGIESLPPGHCIEIQRKPSFSRYWELDTESTLELTYDNAVANVAEILKSSVARESSADVPLGSCLSGGLDSSSVAALASQSVPGLHTYAVGYRSNSEQFERHPGSLVGEVVGDDFPLAARVAETFGTHHHGLYLETDDLLGALDRIIWHREKPPVTLSEFGHYSLSKNAAHDVKVLLSGQGSDEIFGGYYYWLQRRSEANTRTFPWLPQTAESEVDRGTASGMMRWLLGDSTSGSNAADALRSNFQDLIAQVPGQDFHRKLSYVFLKVHLHEMLELEDRNGMASSVECRVPFLDHRLVECVFRVPTLHKTVGTVEKQLLRDAVQRLVPGLGSEVIARKKSPMPPLLDVSSIVPDMIQTVGHANSFVSGLVDRPRLREFLNDARKSAAGRPNAARYALLRLYFLERWHNLYFGGNGPDAATTSRQLQSAPH